MLFLVKNSVILPVQKAKVINYLLKQKAFAMKYSIELACPSSKEWVDTVMSDFDAFLQDHADCERKASAMAMSLVAKYPDCTEMIPELIETGIEELEHFQQVYQLMEKRGIQLRKEIPQDLYVKGLLEKIHTDQKRRFLDRLLLGSIIECRGAERFKMVCDALEDPELKLFYRDLWTSEAKHGNIFVKFALLYFPEEQVYTRLNELNELEGEILQSLPLKPALH